MKLSGVALSAADDVTQRSRAGSARGQGCRRAQLPAELVRLGEALVAERGPTAQCSLRAYFSRRCDWIGIMASLPIQDRFGNTLTDIRVVTEDELTQLAEHIAVPASLVVVVLSDVVLMMFDRRRKQWELPGGTREHGETNRQTAVRELQEETGIHLADPTFAAIAEFELTKPARREFLAVYRGQLQVAPQLVVNEEALGFRWWRLREPVSDGMSPLDAEIARRVFDSSIT